MMKKDFGQPSTTRSYYQIKNVDAQRKVLLRWCMEKVFILMKFDYMSKESYAPLYAVESGESISWATILHDKIMIEIGSKDRRKAQVKRKLGSYLKALFDVVQIHHAIPLHLEKSKLGVLQGGKSKKRKQDQGLMVKDMTEDQLSAYYSLITTGVMIHYKEVNLCYLHLHYQSWGLR